MNKGPTLMGKKSVFNAIFKPKTGAGPTQAGVSFFSGGLKGFFQWRFKGLFSVEV